MSSRRAFDHLLTLALAGMAEAHGEAADLKRERDLLRSKLTALMFMLCIAQLGPVLVLLPAVVWVYWSGDSAWGTFLLVWTLVVGTMDNFLRPLLIKKGADLPLLLIFAGVIGGLITFGVVGIFVGPVVLAVAYTLLDAWVEDDSGRALPPAANG